MSPVKGRQASPRLIPGVQPSQLDPANRCVDTVESRSITDPAHVILAVLVSPTIPYAPRSLRELGIVGGDHSTVSTNGHILRRIEREAPRLAYRADPFTSKLGTVSLASILDEFEACLAGDLEKLVHCGWMTVQVDGDKRTGLWTDLRPSLTRTQIYSRVFHICEDRLRACMEDGVGCRDEREGCCDHLAAVADAEGLQ